MKKKLGIIGCGIAALPILQKAREMGVETFCFALNEIDKTKGLPDHFIEVDIFDIDAIYKECLKVNLDGIIATSEISTEVTAILANKLGLPGNSIENGFAGRSKFLMRERVKNVSGVCQPKFFLYGDNEEFSYPVMVKALDGCGKNGITLARNEHEFKEAVTFAENTSSNGAVLIEEYIESGVEYSIECLSCNDKHYIIQTTQKDSSGPPHFAEMGHHQPGVPRESEKFKLIEKSVSAILHAVGITNSISHVEIKITDDNKVYFIELGARAGGGYIGDTLVGLSTGYDFFKGAIDIALGQFTPPIIDWNAYSGIYYLCDKTRYLLPLYNEAEHAPWCKKFRKPQTAISSIVVNSDRENAGMFIYQSDHKIGLADVNFIAERINEDENAFSQLYAWNKKIGRELSEQELTDGINKFIEKGNVIAIRSGAEIIAFLNVYCNDYETKNAYINNVEVYHAYRGLGLSKLLMDKAVQLCIDAGFKTITLHVARENKAAVGLYRKYGFSENEKGNSTDIRMEMIKTL